LYSLKLEGSAQHSSIRRFNLLYANTLRLARTLDQEQALQVLESDVQLFVAEHARRRLFVHAGVVAWNGGAIVIPGASFSGKSTLVAALVRAGATYYSDEYAVFDARGRVHAYPRPLSLRIGDRMTSIDLPPESLGRKTRRPLPVSSVVVTSYTAGARWRARVLSPAQGVIALLAHTVAARRQPQVALSVLARAIDRAAVLKSVRGEADGLVELLLGQGTRQQRRPIGVPRKINR
jgi:hypothetical protein